MTNCMTCIFFNNSTHFCNRYKVSLLAEIGYSSNCKRYVFKDSTAEELKKAHVIIKKGLAYFENKGLAIRNKKLNKLLIKRNKIEASQETYCRYISFVYQDIKRINGKYRHVGQNHCSGLQIRNRVYLINGKYKLVNNRGVKITKVYDEQPKWATPKQIEMYNKFMSSNVKIEYEI